MLNTTNAVSSTDSRGAVLSRLGSHCSGGASFAVHDETASTSASMPMLSGADESV
jgi:hypothetical protein